MTRFSVPSVRSVPAAPAPLPARSAAPGLFTLADLDCGAVTDLVRRACVLAHEPGAHDLPLRDLVVGILFTKTSTRTRTAFTVGTARLGGVPVGYGPGDLQTNTGESLTDTGRILGSMLDLLVARTAGPVEDMRELARAGRLPVVNAMAAEEHPTQGLCDLATMHSHFGSLDGIRVLYVGEGNNTAAALAHGLARVPGARLTLATPRGFGLGSEILRSAQAAAEPVGTTIHQVQDLAELPDEIDVVYTTRWQTTGTSKANAAWRELFRPFHVDAQLMRRWPAAWFMHDLPAQRGDEVTGEVLDGPRSLAWAQARMKLYSAMAVLEAVASDTEGRRELETGR